MPVAFYWDTDDHRLIVCETRSIPNESEKDGVMRNKVSKFSVTPSKSEKQSLSLDTEPSPESQANVLFVTMDNRSELKELETINLVPGERVLNLCSPFIVSENYCGYSRE